MIFRCRRNKLLTVFPVRTPLFLQLPSSGPFHCSSGQHASHAYFRHIIIVPLVLFPRTVRRWLFIWIGLRQFLVGEKTSTIGFFQAITLATSAESRSWANNAQWFVRVVSPGTNYHRSRLTVTPVIKRRLWGTIYDNRGQFYHAIRT